VLNGDDDSGGAVIEVGVNVNFFDCHHSLTTGPAGDLIPLFLALKGILVRGSSSIF
jgi:hypothetical protein